MPNPLREAREARRWSRAELARRSKLNPATIGLIESGRFRPYPSQIAKLARALGVSVREAAALVEPGSEETSAPGPIAQPAAAR